MSVDKFLICFIACSFLQFSCSRDRDCDLTVSIEDITRAHMQAGQAVRSGADDSVWRSYYNDLPCKKGILTQADIVWLVAQGWRGENCVWSLSQVNTKLLLFIGTTSSGNSYVSVHRLSDNRDVVVTFDTFRELWDSDQLWK